MTVKDLNYRKIKILVTSRSWWLFLLTVFTFVTVAVLRCSTVNRFLISDIKVLEDFKSLPIYDEPPFVDNSTEENFLRSAQQKKLAQLKPFEPVMNDTEKETFIELIKVFTATMRQCKLQFVITGGTLLGSWRHHGFIPWDDDLDVVVNSIDRKQMETCFSKLEPGHILAFAGSRVKFHSKDGVKLHDYGWLWPYIDVTFYTKNGSYLVEDEMAYDKVQTYPVGMVFPLRSRPFEKMWLPAPRDAFGILVWTYGISEDCATLEYSHQVEDSISDTHEMPCKDLQNKYAFVKHTWWFSKNKMQERLIKHGQLVHTIYTNEPQYAESDMYGLKLKNHQSLPAHVHTPAKT